MSIHWKVQGIKWPDVVSKAEELISEASKLEKDGAEKHAHVVNALADWIDTQLVFGNGPVGRLAESLDRPVAKAILSLLIEFVFQELRSGGQV